MMTMDNKKEEVIIHKGDFPYIVIVDENETIAEFWWVKKSNKLEIFFELVSRGHDQDDLSVLW